ncbi:flagellar basal body L-ring protein FlgH [bacterium]|nr:flagellar basal body L-ring protein FlgH [bacterium]
MRYVTILTIMLLVMSGRAMADSLFSQPEDSRPGRSGVTGRPPVSVEIGDIVKVKVREKTDANIDLGLQIQDQSQVDAGNAVTDKLLKKAIGPLFDVIGVGDIAYNSGTNYNGDGKTDRKVRVDSMLSVRVVDMEENGLLTIAGVKYVTVNNEKQYMLIRGTVDPRDLNSDLVVESDLVADLEIEYIGEGALSKRSKPGIVTRFFDMIF